MLQCSNGDAGGIFFGGEVFFWLGVLVAGVVAILPHHIIAGGPGFRGALPHPTWLACAVGAASAGKKPQTLLSLELRDLFAHVSLTAVPGH